MHIPQSILFTKSYTEQTIRWKVDVEEHKLRVELGELEMRFMLKIAELEKKIEMLKTEVEVANYERNVLKKRVDG